MSLSWIKSKIERIDRRAVRRVLSVLCIVAAVGALLSSFVTLQAQRVCITVDGAAVAEFFSAEQLTPALLARADIQLGANDRVTREAQGNDIVLHVRRAFAVTVAADGAEKNVYLAGGTVSDALTAADISLREHDTVTPSLTTALQMGTKITVTRCQVKFETKTETIAFETVKEKTDTLYEGVTQVAQQGEDGEKKVTYRLVYRNGKLQEKTPEKTETTKAPKDQKILVGTKKNELSVDTDKLSFSRVLTVTATAYSGEKPSGQITCLGKVPSWGTVAVDPRVIPLGTKMYIASPDGKTVYGYCVAGDTGGAIKGNRVDLFMPTEQECNTFGRRTMCVYILK